MKIEFHDPEKRLMLEEITAFENHYNINLPDNYKKLISKYNGGLIEYSENIDTLLSIKYGKIKVEDIIKIHQVIEHNIPKEYFPFAVDFSNNPITLCLENGLNYGKIIIFYFDVDRIEIIANSLEELLGVTSIDEL